MARLFTNGFELQSPGMEYGWGWTFGADAGITAETGTVRSGGASAKATGTGWTQTWTTRSSVDGRRYYARGYYRFAGLPDASLSVLSFIQSSAVLIGARVSASGKLQLFANGSQVGSDSAVTFTTDVWYRIELMGRITTGAGDEAELRLDGEVVASTTGQSWTDSSITDWAFGIGDYAGSSVTFYMDDLALNDDQGTSQNSWPGEGRVWLLKPAADSAIGSNWQAPQTTGSDVTNIYLSVDNTPPLGVAHSDTDANNARYIFETTSGTNINYDATCQSYLAAGVPATERIALAQVIANHGSSSATNTTGAVKLVSNPADAGETSLIFDNGIAGTFPTNWFTTAGAVVYDPAVAMGTGPVARIGKRTATTRVVMCDFLGVLVESAPGADLVMAPPVPA